MSRTQRQFPHRPSNFGPKHDEQILHISCGVTWTGSDKVSVNYGEVIVKKSEVKKLNPKELITIPIIVTALVALLQKEDTKKEGFHIINLAITTKKFNFPELVARQKKGLGVPPWVLSMYDKFSDPELIKLFEKLAKLNDGDYFDYITNEDGSFDVCIKRNPDVDCTKI
jgi:hypothetical protein